MKGLIAIVVIWAVIALAFVHTLPATGQAVVPEQSPLITACAAANAQAAAQDVHIEWCRRYEETTLGKDGPPAWAMVRPARSR